MAKSEVIERFAIQDLLARYAHAIDDLNPEEWARCFTRDGVFQLGSQALAATQRCGRMAKSMSGKIAVDT